MLLFGGMFSCRQHVFSVGNSNLSSSLLHYVTRRVHACALSFVDKNGDLMFTCVQSLSHAAKQSSTKLNTMATDIRFNDETSMLAVLQVSRQEGVLTMRA